MKSMTIKIAYAGSAVDNGVMDIKDLAPALLSLGQLIEEANRTLNGNDAQIRVLVKSDIRRGSFELNLDVIQNLSDQVKLLLGMTKNIDLNELLNSIGLAAGISGFTLLELIKKLKGKKPKSATIIENGSVRIEINGDSNHEYIEVKENVVKLYKSLIVRQKIEETLKPLEKHGIDRFEVRNVNNNSEKEVIASVGKTDLDYFIAPEAVESEAVISERRALLRIANLSFDESNKWRLDDGDCKLWATITDISFLDQVDNREIGFAKGDTLEVNLKTTQTIGTKGLKTEHEITQVIKVHPKPSQLPLFDITPLNDD
ncbi:hypothetical protein [Sporomusa sphaeroides]|uniref:hypothetical protein n=1 Tax=Sporomusa sphaeroides TaxID=47679 RepID=UPI00202EE451|nr:hypothetical protein [Sporomusa sphaeroides]MCM0758126.1 hypothetical protein [Sporomusa sphaeroides DSM 2875]HML33883.1 hypothetical protein [Sporomusa sphaeroides]